MVDPKRYKGEAARHLLELPDHLINTICHSILLKDAAGLRETNQFFQEVLPKAKCLDNYVLEWDTPGWPGAQCPCNCGEEAGSPDCDCEDWVSLPSADYRFRHDLWYRVFVSDDLLAAKELFQRQEGDEDFDDITLCDKSHIQSRAMWTLLCSYTDTDLNSSVLDMYMHLCEQHPLQDAEKCLRVMIDAGADMDFVASELIADFDRVYHLRDHIRYHQQGKFGANGLVRAMKKVLPLLEVEDRWQVDMLWDCFGISVVHLLVAKCTPQLENAILAALVRLFPFVMTREDRNRRDEQGYTVLQRLYQKRPLNRNLLQYFNRWQHDNEYFLY